MYPLPDQPQPAQGLLYVDAVAGAAARPSVVRYSTYAVLGAQPAVGSAHVAAAREAREAIALAEAVLSQRVSVPIARAADAARATLQDLEALFGAERVGSGAPGGRWGGRAPTPWTCHGRAGREARDADAHLGRVRGA